MKVLIACEFSGIVREAFKAKGHDVWSCDLLPTEIPGQHIQGDVLAILNDGWDLMIAHPPCTYLSVSGMHWTTRGLRDPKLTEDALGFVRFLLDCTIPKIALENPISVISTRIRKPNQIIQPWMFGENASKSTCLWLKDLGPLKPTRIVPPAGWQLVHFASEFPLCECCGEAFCEEHDTHFWECDCYGPTQDGLVYKTISGYLFAKPSDINGKPIWGNQTKSGQNNLPPGANRASERSRTYPGIAQAMAEQWTQ